MGTAEYVLYVDDTGFNANKKNSKVLQSEIVTYAGVLVNKELEPHLTTIMQNLCSLLKQRYSTTEFHFTDIYNRREPYQNIQFDETLDMLGMFAELFNELDLKIFVHTCNNNVSQNQQTLNQLINVLAPHLHLSQDAKTQAFTIVYLKAQNYLNKQLNSAKITNIICDEGLRKNGAEEIIKNNNVQLSFKSSAECKLLQLADYAAWYITRAKHIYDKASTNKKLSDADKAVLEIYSQLTDNYVGLSKQKIDIDNLQEFDYDSIYQQLLNKE